MAQTPFEIEFDDITLARAKRGHLPSCELIFRAFQQPAYSVAFRICQCPETAQEVLQEAMVQYDGSIIIVSHNRHFVNGFINKVLEIKDKKGTTFEGNIDDYLYKMQMLQDAAAEHSGETELAAGFNDKNGKPTSRALRQEQA